MSQTMAEPAAKALAKQIAQCLGRPVPKSSDLGYAMTKEGTRIRVYVDDMVAELADAGEVYVKVSLAQ